MVTAKEITHIVPIGFTPDKLIASVRQHPIHKLIIVTLSGDENRERVKNVLKKLNEAFKGIEIEKVVIERENVFQAALDLLEIIEKEAKNGKLVKINISGGMRNIGISAYIAALVSKVGIYTDIPESKEEPYRLKGILEIPPFPIKEIPKEQIEILQKLDGGVESLDELISKLKPDLKKGTMEYNNERSRLSHHLKKLGGDGFINTEKKKKAINIWRSMLGNIYLKGKEIESMLKEGDRWK